MDPLRCQFLANNDEVTIVPSITNPELHLIGGTVKKFVAGVPTKVPLWLAIFLRRRLQCRVVPYEWLTADALRKIAAKETETDGFGELPNRFFEKAHLLLTKCCEDIPNSEQARTLVKDIWDMRTSKMKTSTITFLSEEPRADVQIDNVTQFEISYARAFLTNATSKITSLATFYGNFE